MARPGAQKPTLITVAPHTGQWFLTIGSLGLAALLGLGCYSGSADSETDSDTGDTMQTETETGSTTGGEETTDGEETTEGPETTGGEEDCYSTRDYFADAVWAPLMGQVCLQCHGPTGVAAEKNAKFLLLPPEYPGFIEANLENIKDLAGYSYEGVPLLLAKPAGLAEHEGGVVLPEGSAGYEAFEELLIQLQEEVVCEPQPVTDTFEDVSLLTPVETLRKATLHLAGRLPSESEVELVEQGGDDALRLVLDDLMTEEGFYNRLLDVFNDIFLTDQYIANSTQTRAVGLLANADFPNRAIFINNDDAMFTAAERRRINQAVAREPLDLINYIVRNDRPFTEILTAPYTVFTPDSAWIYGVDVAFEDPTDFSELQEGVLTINTYGEEQIYPHAGILSSPMWLNRFPTTSTNRNRHRSRMIYAQFLATDILALASVALDPESVSSTLNPSRDNPDCSKCHQIIDPIAGTFQMFSKTDPERLLEEPDWFPEMFAPGFGKESMDPEDYADGLQWLAERITEDPRFGLSVARHMYKALTGHTPLPYPTDVAHPFHDQLLVAWEVQDEFLRSIAAQFVGDNHNLKTVIREIVLSPYYRASHLEAPPSAERAAELTDVGTARLSTPELLSVKVEAVTGYKWPGLTGEYELLYGGMDSDEITTRLSDVNHIMTKVAERMSVEVACKAVSFDFSKPAEERLLFPLVEPSDVPGPGTLAIKANLRHLYRHVLGIDLNLDDPELQRAFDIYAETREDGAASVMSEDEGSEGVDIVSTCRATVDPNTGEAIAAENQIVADENYSVRAWTAVLTYLLLDYRFLYE